MNRLFVSCVPLFPSVSALLSRGEVTCRARIEKLK